MAMLDGVPALIEQGLTKYEIAEQFGITPGSLTVMCSKRGISLRKGGRHKPSGTITLPLPISLAAMMSLRSAAVSRGGDTKRLAIDLLERIASDDLYNAVLDEEAA
jgi:hypothetical protein